MITMKVIENYHAMRVEEMRDKENRRRDNKILCQEAGRMDLQK